MRKDEGFTLQTLGLRVHGSIPEQRPSLKLSEVPGISRLFPMENLGDCFPVSQDSVFILISLFRLS